MRKFDNLLKYMVVDFMFRVLYSFLPAYCVVKHLSFLTSVS